MWALIRLAEDYHTGTDYILRLTNKRQKSTRWEKKLSAGTGLRNDIVRCAHDEILAYARL